MGQGWSGEATVGGGPASQHQGRIRADSEPPVSSGGGHSVCKIPEDEPLDAKTTEMQYADWKEASGILKDKGHLLQRPITIVDPGGGGGQKAAKRPAADYQHFVDYSMFPDKFSPASASSPSTPPSTPLQSVTSAFFRARATSESSPPPPTDAEVRGQSGLSLEPEARRRSRSYSGRLPFFDFSMIPDKDPNYGGSRRVRRRSEEPAAAPAAVEVEQDPASLVAAALTMAAATDKQQEPPPKRSPTATKRFTFFDYSMIPDKDPRASCAGVARREKRPTPAEGRRI